MTTIRKNNAVLHNTTPVIDMAKKMLKKYTALAAGAFMAGCLAVACGSNNTVGPSIDDPIDLGKDTTNIVDTTRTDTTFTDTTRADTSVIVPPILDGKVIFDSSWTKLINDMFENGYRYLGEPFPVPPVSREIAMQNFQLLQDRMDSAYVALSELTGQGPIGEWGDGNNVRAYVVPNEQQDEPGVAKSNTNEFLIRRQHAINELHEIIMSDYSKHPDNANRWGYIFLHELGHLFDITYHDRESTANLLAAYVLEKFGGRFRGVGEPEKFRRDRFEASAQRYYDGVMKDFQHGGSEHNTAFTMYSFGLVEHAGWDAFKQAFQSAAITQIDPSMPRMSRAVVFYDEVAKADGRGRDIFKLLPDGGQLFEVLARDNPTVRPTSIQVAPKIPNQIDDNLMAQIVHFGM
jgi:hypothetical protein